MGFIAFVLQGRMKPQSVVQLFRMILQPESNKKCAMISTLEIGLSETCTLAKVYKLLFPTSTSYSKSTFDLAHAYVWGPLT